MVSCSRLLVNGNASVDVVPTGFVRCSVSFTGTDGHCPGTCDLNSRLDPQPVHAAHPAAHDVSCGPEIPG